MSFELEGEEWPDFILHNFLISFRRSSMLFQPHSHQEHHETILASQHCSGMKGPRDKGAGYIYTK